ncbi:unnamed protein product [Amoebophrya sp. A120]|nr:unnamed protein product [Amoebophrya sp. A120]|eukprot:GSA120T00000754001.1
MTMATGISTGGALRRTLFVAAAVAGENGVLAAKKKPKGFLAVAVDEGSEIQSEQDGRVAGREIGTGGAFLDEQERKTTQKPFFGALKDAWDRNSPLARGGSLNTAIRNSPVGQIFGAEKREAEAKELAAKAASDAPNKNAQDYAQLAADSAVHAAQSAGIVQHAATQARAAASATAAGDSFDGTTLAHAGDHHVHAAPGTAIDGLLPDQQNGWFDDGLHEQAQFVDDHLQDWYDDTHLSGTPPGPPALGTPPAKHDQLTINDGHLPHDDARPVGQGEGAALTPAGGAEQLQQPESFAMDYDDGEGDEDDFLRPSDDPRDGGNDGDAGPGESLSVKHTEDGDGVEAPPKNKGGFFSKMASAVGKGFSAAKKHIVEKFAKAQAATDADAAGSGGGRGTSKRFLQRRGQEPDASSGPAAIESEKADPKEPTKKEKLKTALESISPNVIPADQACPRGQGPSDLVLKEVNDNCNANGDVLSDKDSNVMFGIELHFLVREAGDQANGVDDDGEKAEDSASFIETETTTAMHEKPFAWLKKMANSNTAKKLSRMATDAVKSVSRHVEAGVEAAKALKDAGGEGGLAKFEAVRRAALAQKQQENSEEDAKIEEAPGISAEICHLKCMLNRDCRFYKFQAVHGTTGGGKCTLSRSLDHLSVSPKCITPDGKEANDAPKIDKAKSGSGCVSEKPKLGSITDGDIVELSTWFASFVTPNAATVALNDLEREAAAIKAEYEKNKKQEEQQLEYAGESESDE